jgi:hypothetical protein
VLAGKVSRTEREDERPAGGQPPNVAVGKTTLVEQVPAVGAKPPALRGDEVAAEVSSDDASESPRTKRSTGASATGKPRHGDVARHGDAARRGPAGHAARAAAQAAQTPQHGANSDAAPAGGARGQGDGGLAADNADRNGARAENRDGPRREERAAPTASASAAPIAGERPRGQSPIVDALVNAGGDAPQAAAARARSLDLHPPGPTGGYTIPSVFPNTDLGAGTIPVPGGTGLGGSRTVPSPIYIHPPASRDDRDRR